MYFEKHFKESRRGRKEWIELQGDISSALHGWLALSDNYNEDNDIGRYLKKHGELKTVKQETEEEKKKNGMVIFCVTYRWVGFENAMYFEKHFKVSRRGRKEWIELQGDSSSALHGWFALSDDYNEDNDIGRYLKKHGELKTAKQNHNDAKGLYNVSFPYFSELEMVYGKDRATCLIAEDPMMAAQNITDMDAGLTISGDNSLAEKGVEVDSMSNQQPSVTSRASHSKEKNPLTEFKKFRRGQRLQLCKMSILTSSKSSKMPQVLEMLDKYGFVGKNKYKATQVICEDPVKQDAMVEEVVVSWRQQPILQQEAMAGEVVVLWRQKPVIQQEEEAQEEAETEEVMVSWHQQPILQQEAEVKKVVVSRCQKPNTGYLNLKKGLGIVDVVSNALSNTSFNKQPNKQVFIQFNDIQVLFAFKQIPGYTCVLTIEETINDAPKPTMSSRRCTQQTSLLVSFLRNEYLAISFDYFSDPIVEIATLKTLYDVSISKKPNWELTSNNDQLMSMDRASTHVTDLTKSPEARAPSEFRFRGKRLVLRQSSPPNLSTPGGSQVQIHEAKAKEKHYRESAGPMGDLAELDAEARAAKNKEE
ncbi:hypothetical protein ZIOFF_008968 [Zingiber officinale]|uniref:XS domain-containing protein n=1 Tax=Zingiber officinale TaxID=94328 RepID=A0A8J5I254_ZINOF|nr:hypothetical protein ZIOFF_008968 [Zingiber officinale]